MFTQLVSQESGYLMVQIFLDKGNWIIFNGMNTYFVCWFVSYLLEYVLHFDDAYSCYFVLFASQNTCSLSSLVSNLGSSFFYPPLQIKFNDPKGAETARNQLTFDTIAVLSKTKINVSHALAFMRGRINYSLQLNLTPLALKALISLVL